MTPTNRPPIHDAMGREIFAGDKVVYSAADGRSAVLRRGRVVEAYWKDTSTGPEPRILIECERYNRWSRTWLDMHTKITLRHPERIAVVGRSLPDTLTRLHEDGTLDEQRS